MSASATPLSVPGQSAPSVAEPVRRSAGIELGHKILLAGLSNCAASNVTNPMDLVKVRQQLEGQNATLLLADGQKAKSSTFWGTTLVRMIRDEGVLSIYKGLSASMMREMSYSGIRFGAYDGCKGLVLAVVPESVMGKDSFGVKLGAGMLSGMLGAGVANPADVIKIRMQSAGATGTMRDHARIVYEKNGLKGFYRALYPTVFRAGVLTAAQLGVYDQAKHTLIADFPTIFSEGFGTHLLASTIAGFCCSAVSAPIDTIKVRMMADVQHKFKGSLHCTAMLLKHDGPLALYRGSFLCWLRLAPHSTISLLIFEELRKATGLRPI